MASVKTKQPSDRIIKQQQQQHANMLTEPLFGDMRLSSKSASVSPSSLQSNTTDSDSFIIEPHQSNNNNNNNNNNDTNNSPISPTSPQQQAPNKSPILIKYNYYDYNGERQENYELHQQRQQVKSMAPIVQRQLSPTFKQNLDQIVKNSQKLISIQQQQQQRQQEEQNENINYNTMTLLTRRYKLSSYEHNCLRCAKTVYQMDKVGPLKEFTFYHQNCFKCFECGTKLTLKTYFNNQHSSSDLEVYCHRHCPKAPAGKLDNQSVGIRAALNAPKVFDATSQQCAASQLLACSPILNSDHLGGAIASSHLLNSHNHNSTSTIQPQVDSRALYIQHAVEQTKLQSIYKQTQVDKKISQFLNRRLEFLEPKQKLLEMRHREEEEQLFKVFEQKWHQEEAHIRDQIRDEWQLELNKLLDKYKRQLAASTHNQLQRQHRQQQQQQQLASGGARIDFHRSSLATSNGTTMMVQCNGDQIDESSEQKLIEMERLNLEKTMTIKLDRKKETLKRKLKEFERQATAELVEKQSREMLNLISLKLEEFKEEQKRKIGSDLEQFEAIETLANQLDSSLQLSVASATHQQQVTRRAAAAAATRPDTTTATTTTTMAPVSLRVPPPAAPQLTKMDLYNSEQPDEVFKDIDELAINVAKEDQNSFTDLVHALTRHCLTDMEKVRAIFRWITVKNLNTMHFDDANIKPDTPLGLLRGIKQGSESYHVLFKRLCSYAGLHCVVIKGYSKSAGYQPGVRFEGNRFRNSWNAVYVAGAWRFVQCNWGARHLVSVAVMQDKNSSSSNSSQQQQQPAGRRSGVVSVTSHQGQKSGAPNHGRRGHISTTPSSSSSSSLSPTQQLHSTTTTTTNLSPAFSSSSTSSLSTHSSSSSCSSPVKSNISQHHHHQRRASNKHEKRLITQVADNVNANNNHQSIDQRQTTSAQNDSLRYEYDDHYFLTDPDEFIYEFYPMTSEWQLLKTRPISLTEFEQLPFVRSLFFKYGLYFPQPDIRSVLVTNSSGATTIKIGMPTHMIPSLIFHYNLKYFNSEQEHCDGISLKRFVMQSVESGGSDQEGGNLLLSNIVSFRVHVPENGSYILDIFANSTTPRQYITGEPMKFKSVCKFKIVAKNLRTVMVALPDCASGEYGPMKATRLFGIIPITHENGLIAVQNDKRLLEIQFRMTRPLLDFMASLHKNGCDERQLSKLIKIFIDGDIVFISIKFLDDGQYGLDIYTRDQQLASVNNASSRDEIANNQHRNNKVATNGDLAEKQPKKQLLTHCCKYLINVRGAK